MKAEYMNQNIETCDQCRFFHPFGYCYANPPTVSEYLLKRTEEQDPRKILPWEDVVERASVRPIVAGDERACRFFAGLHASREGGAA